MTIRTGDILKLMDDDRSRFIEDVPRHYPLKEAVGDYVTVLDHGRLVPVYAVGHMNLLKPHLVLKGSRWYRSETG